MCKLLKHFERIVIISLLDRSDRREKLLANLSQCGLAKEEDITWFDAVDGRKADVPKWWESGPGAWGCRFSQLKVIQEAQHDGLQNVLVIEDDAVFHPRTAEWLDATMPLLPPDWGQFFLGGQHMKSPTPTEHPKLVKAKGITRTHAYAVNQPAYQVIIDQIADDAEYKKRPGWHVDHQFSHCQMEGYWTAYAPSWWMAGQEEGQSNIVQASLGRRWWQEGRHYWKLPIVCLPESSSLHTSEMLHFPEKPVPEDHGELALWLRCTAHDAWLQGRLPSCGANSMKLDEISRFWPAGVRYLESEHELVELADYPTNGLFSHPFSNV